MIIRHQLMNGARVLIEEIPHVHSASTGVYVKVGSRHESEETHGVAHFLEHMLFKGTERYSAREIAEIFESMGGQLNAYTSREHTCFYARVLDENIEEAMDVLFDMLFNSTLTGRDIDVERGVILEEINMYEDSPDELVHDLLSQTILDGHSLGRPILGTSERISSVTPDVIRDFYHTYYQPGNMIIAVAGNVNSEKILKKLESYSGYKPELFRIPDDGGVPQPKQGITLVRKDTEQVQICLGVPGICYTDERRYTQNMMNSILGGGMSSRLFQKIREEKGLAYSVYSYSSNYRDAGIYAIYVGTSPSKVKDFFALLKDELDRFVDNGVTIEEVERARKQMKASLYLGMESIMTRMNRLGKSELLYGEVISVEQMVEKMMAVTPAMISDFAEKVLGSGQFSLAGIGEEDVLGRIEEEFCKLWPVKQTN